MGHVPSRNSHTLLPIISYYTGRVRTAYCLSVCSQHSVCHLFLCVLPTCVLPSTSEPSLNILVEKTLQVQC